MNESLKTAKNCRHYAMCKIDFLGSGVCTSGLEKHFVSFYPQGRMILYESLADNKITVTEKCVEIADSCNMCGKCDYQRYFLNEMRPTKVMEALKNHVATFIKNGGKIKTSKDDILLTEIKKIVGKDWATNDEAITITYSHDLSAISEPKLPGYVVLPGTKEEIAALVKLFNKNKITYTLRGNGQNLLGFAINEGVIIDLNRMKTIEFDEKNWLVKVGPGVAAFDLQKQAQKRGYRINAAEPAALLCANIMCSGIMSTFSTTYGINADNFINAEFVDHNGSFFNLNETSSPNLYSYKNLEHKNSPGICVADIRLHPVTDDEPYSYLKVKSFAQLFETALSPSAKLYAQQVDKDLIPFFEKLFSLPEMTDLVWLNMYRIMSTRLGRKKPFLPALLYLPIDKKLINEFSDKFRLIAEKHHIDNDFGFITPIDNGKRCIFEYDFFYDYNDPEEIKRIRQVGMEANMLIDEYSVETGVVKGHPYVLYQGFCRKENLLYS